MPSLEKGLCLHSRRGLKPGDEKLGRVKHARVKTSVHVHVGTVIKIWIRGWGSVQAQTLPPLYERYHVRQGLNPFWWCWQSQTCLCWEKGLREHDHQGLVSSLWCPHSQEGKDICKVIIYVVTSWIAQGDATPPLEKKKHKVRVERFICAAPLQQLPQWINFYSYKESDAEILACSVAETLQNYSGPSNGVELPQSCGNTSENTECAFRILRDPCPAARVVTQQGASLERTCLTTGFHL